VIDRLLAGRTDAAIAVSRSVADFMVRSRSIPSDRIEVVFNGAPLAEFRPIAGDALEAERRRWKLPPGCPVLGTIGRLDEQKGLCHLVDAMPGILAVHPRARLVIVGDGPLQGALEEQCRRLGVRDRVVFTGFCADVRAVQSLFDVQVFPSLWEGTPLTVFEAMAMGRPIVSTPADGLGEVLRHGETALLVPLRDADSLAAATVSLLADRAAARRLGAAAREESLGYDIDATVDRLSRVYERLASRRGLRSALRQGA